MKTDVENKSLQSQVNVLWGTSEQPKAIWIWTQKGKWSSATERNTTAQMLENVAAKWTVLKVLSIWKVLVFVKLWSCNVTVRRIQLVELAVGDLKLIWRDKEFPKKQKKSFGQDVQVFSPPCAVVIWTAEKAKTAGLLNQRLLWCLARAQHK